MSEFIAGPRWRERASPAARMAAIAVTFACFVAFGLGVFVVLVVGFDKVGVPAWTTPVIWLALAATLVPWALGSPGPATVSDYEAQPWSTFVVRYVMVGLEDARPPGVRLLAIIVFGPPLYGWAVAYGILSLAGVV